VVLFIFEYALARLLMKWGIKPRAMIGYSQGEYVAACISGVFTLAQALEAVVERGKLIRQTPPGAMLGVPLPKKDVLPLLENHRDIWLSIDNGISCVVGGTPSAVDAFENRMKQKRLLCTPVNTTHVVHSGLMNPIRGAFEARLEQIPGQAPRNDVEKKIAGIWEEFLGIKRIGIHANFFHLNGDSLSATQVIARIKDSYPIEIQLQEFFETPTIVHLAELIKKRLIEKIKNLSPAEKLKLAGKS
jgi:acyl carrier protein